MSSRSILRSAQRGIPFRATGSWKRSCSCTPTTARSGWRAARLCRTRPASGLLVGVDPRRTEVVWSICETVDFHGGRPWAVEVAVWDLVGRSLGEPLWRLLGGRSDSLVAYASTGERVSAEERVAASKTWVADGLRAVKLRFHHQDWREDVEVVEAVRDAVGSGVEILVDANQGGGCRATSVRPGTSRPRRRAHERSSGPTSTGWRSPPDLRRRRLCGAPRRTSLRVAAGEMVRTLHEARDLILRGGVDVVQPDVMLAGGIGGAGGSPPSRTPRATRSARTRGRTGSAWSRTSISRWRCRRCRSSRCRSILRPGARSAGTGCCRGRSRSRPTARSARPRVRVWA